VSPFSTKRSVRTAKTSRTINNSQFDMGSDDNGTEIDRAESIAELEQF